MTTQVHPAYSPSSIPRYAEDHAPIFRLHPDDRYRPTPLTAFLSHVRPQLNFKDTQPTTALPSLADLDELNTHSGKGGEDIYLTSYDDVTKNPRWLDGVTRFDSLGGTDSQRTSAIIIVEKGEGVVDVFYFVFWAFNYGGVVLNKNLGNHVGDWEHVMIRFKGDKPKTVWLSQHGNGEAYTFKTLEKDESGKRPILYVAKGSHAIYARTGNIDHTIPNFNTTLPFLLVDQCEAGQRFDPVLSSYIYAYTPASTSVTRHNSTTSERPEPTSQQSSPKASLIPGTFKPMSSWTPQPGWLYFNGHWGDQAYEAADPRQQSLLGFQKFVDGPTGPAFKQLVRKKVWPENSHAAGQIVRTSLDGSTRLKDQLRRWVGKCFGGKKAMKVRGKPERVFVDGTAVGNRAVGKDKGVLIDEKAVDKAEV